MTDEEILALYCQKKRTSTSTCLDGQGATRAGVEVRLPASGARASETASESRGRLSPSPPAWALTRLTPAWRSGQSCL